MSDKEILSLNESLDNTSPVLYFDINWALKQHGIVLNESGGLPGILNKGQLEGILNAIKDDYFYPYFIDKITHLVFSICEYHVFADANKRTSIALGAYFLKINGYENCIDQFITDMEYLVVMLVEHKFRGIPSYIDKDEKEILAEFIVCIINELDYPIELENLLIQYTHESI